MTRTEPRRARSARRLTVDPRASHGDDELASGPSFLEVANGLGNLGQRVGPVDHRGELPRFDELGEGDQVGLGWGPSRARGCAATRPVPSADDPPSADDFQPAVRKLVPVRAGQCAAQERAHQRPAGACPRCRSMPVSSIRVQAAHHDLADEPRTNDQEGLTAFWRSGLRPGLLGSGGGI